MNDFTKEELIALSDGLRIMYKNGWDRGYPFRIDNLYDKVCAMIYAYPCEHKTHFDTGPCDCQTCISAPVIKFNTMTSCTECKENIALELYECPTCHKVYK